MGTTPEKNLQTLTFLLAEIGVIMIKAIHIVLRYAIHLYDLNHTGLWEHKGRYVSRVRHVTFLPIQTIQADRMCRPNSKGGLPRAPLL